MLRTTGWVSVLTGLASGTLWFNGGVSRAPLPAQAAPSMALAEGVSGYPLQRTACLAIGVGAAAATECGDLRVSHALPGVRIFNEDVTPTLTYNSEHAHPHLSFPLHVTQLNTTTTPDFVEVQIFAGTAPNPTTLKSTKTWPGSEWPSGQTTTRRITMSYDAINDATGMWFYRIKIANVYGATRVEWPGAITGTRNLVNRSQSPFGAGWWLSGLEEIKTTWPGDGTQRLWIGGDGSTRLFNTSYVNLYDRRDSLWLEGSTWVRRMPEGRRMEFSSAGQHTKTIDRFNRITTFNYTSGRLSSVVLPIGSLTYSFTYGNPTTKLSAVTAPPLGVTARVTAVSGSAGRLTGIKNPGDSTVSFGYLTGVSDSHLMSSRTDRRGTQTTYTYDPAFKFRSSAVTPGFGGSPIVWTVHAGESRGASGSGTPNSLDTLQNATKIDGPRPVADVTQVWQERFGSPRKSVDALGYVTWMLRGLVTGVPSWGEQGWVLQRLGLPIQGTNVVDTMRVIKYAYQVRGNVTSVTDSLGSTPAGPDVTQYVWDQTFDQLTLVTSPSGRHWQYGIDALGRRIWEDGPLGSPSRISYGYDPVHTSQVNQVTLPVVNGAAATTTITYDGTLRNVNRVTSPRGTYTTYMNDAIGRQVLMTTPIDSVATSTYRLRDSTMYSLRGDAVKRRTTPTSGTEVALVETYYNAEGQPDSLRRSSTPDVASVGVVANRWRYDLIGRVLAAIDASARADSSVYDEAGNVVVSFSRRARVQSAPIPPVTRTFDVLNRLRKVTVPAYAYPSRSIGVAAYLGTPYQYTIPARVDTFDYNRGGHLSVAENQHARVRRAYSRRGEVVAETLSIANVPGTDLNVHVYGIESRFDRDGRRIVLRPPAWLMDAGKDSIRFVYDLSDLRDVIGVSGDVSSYQYNARGEVERLARGSLVQEWQYNANGDLIRDKVTQPFNTFPYYPTTTPRDHSLGIDGRGKMVRSKGAVAVLDSLRTTYTAFGALSSRLSVEFAYIPGATLKQTTTETGISDAFAHFSRRDVQATQLITYTGAGSTSSTTYSDERNVYRANTGREQHVLSSYLAPGTQTLTGRVVEFDSAGNVSASLLPASLTVAGEDRVSYYDASDRLVAQDYRLEAGGQTNLQRRALEEYRYDPLGRRVWVRSRRVCNETSYPRTSECLASLVRRTIWDGTQELMEIQRPGGDGDAVYWEQDHGISPLPYAVGGQEDLNKMYGRVLYTPGLVVDQPVSITRYDYADRPTSTFVQAWGTFTLWPVWDSRGTPAFGTFSDGKAHRQLVPGGTQCVEGVPSSPQRCVFVSWQWGNAAWHSQQGKGIFTWQGSVLQDKKDGAGTYYRRNRSYDPQRGRFTQEDPIGLAGGLNLYGFADGDPVNLDDPFGLCPMCVVAGLWAIYEAASGAYDAYQAGKTLLDPNATAGEKATNVGLAAAGLILPGGAYTKLDDAVDLAGDLRNAGRAGDASVEAAKRKTRDIPDRRKPHDDKVSPSKREKHEDTRAPHKDRKRQHDDWNQNPNKRQND